MADTNEKDLTKSVEDKENKTDTTLETKEESKEVEVKDIEKKEETKVADSAKEQEKEEDSENAPDNEPFNAKVIVVTSGKGGVGKTTSSAAIATGLAMTLVSNHCLIGSV